MARQEMFVDLLKLKQVIDQLEDEQIANGAPVHRPFRSRSELHKAVAACDWGQAIGLTPVVVALRIERYAIECKTPVRGRMMTVAPVASVAVSGTSEGVLAAEASGTDPDVTTVSDAPVVVSKRKSMYRGIDLEAFVSPFLERGLDVEALSSIMTSSLHDRNTNLKIQSAWHDLRERFNIPRVGDKPQEITSVMPLDQVRLPGEPVFGEPIPTENLPVFEEPLGDLPTDEELIADEFPEFYKPASTDKGIEQLTDEGLAVEEFDEFYDQATDEEGLDHARDTLNEINQEDIGQETTPDSQFPLGSDDDNFESMDHDDLIYEDEREANQEGEPVSDQDVERELEEWLATGEVPPGEHQELYPENPPQDEYIPLDYDENSTDYVYDAETHDSKMFETEETDPNETR